MDWQQLIETEQNKPYYKKLVAFLNEEYKSFTIYPPCAKVFRAFELTPFKQVKVLILGQDPYHGANQANGLSFSVDSGQKLPPSLKNIYKLVGNEGNFDGDLSYLAKQGVLLLNTVLTVRDGEPNSHKGKGWEVFTDEVIEALNNAVTPIVFLLWGNNAIAKAQKITNKAHLVLTAPHPSPLSAHKGFFDCDHPRLCNEFLQQNGIDIIEWARK